MKFKNDIELQAGLEDLSGSTGTSGQVLSSTGTGTSWIAQDDIISAASKLVVIACKNTHSTTILKGTPVYQTGTVGATDVIEVAPADALISLGHQPAVGLLQQDLAINEFGNVVITGELLNFTTDPIDGLTPVTGQKVFLKSGGGLTLTKPTGVTNGIQNLGLIGKVSGGNSGSITVSSIMRTNDVPNLTTGKIWVGDGNTVESTVVHLDEVNGRMGIGTSSPSDKLDVSGRVVADAFRTDINTSDYSLISRSSAGNAPLYVQSADNSTNQPIAKFFYGNASPNQGALVLNVGKDSSYFTNTNLGIGTTSPLRKLHVDNSSGVGEAVISGTTGATLYFRPNTSYSLAGNFGIFTTGLTSGTYESTMDFKGYYNGVTTPLTIKGSGNVGIGTTSPGFPLHVNTSNDIVGYFKSTDNKASIIIADNDTTGYVSAENDRVSIGYGNGVSTSNITILNGSYNVGIGTTSPQYKIHSSNSGSRNDFQFTLDSFGTGATDGAQLGIQSGGAYIWNFENNDLYFATNNSRALTIKPSGNVGIGTTSPGAPLDVNGEIKSDKTANGVSFSSTGGGSSFTAFDVFTATNGGLLRLYNESTQTVNIDGRSSGGNSYFNNGGNVGIGTTSPAVPLHVTGEIRAYDSGNNYYAQISSPNSSWAYFNTNATRVYINTEVQVNSGLIGSYDEALQLRTSGTTRMYINNSTGNVGINNTNPEAKLDVRPDNGNGKVLRVGNYSVSTYSYNTQADATIDLTCGSYYQAEVIITANQTNGGDYNNIYIRGIWSNNHTTHHWDEIESIGFLTGSSIGITVGENTISNSGKLSIDFNYTSGSFSILNIKVTDFYGTHSYSIS